MRRFACLAACLLWICPPALGRDIFVDNKLGDDRRGGSSAIASGETGPCRSISKALRIAQPSDRIVVANTGQPYRESLTVQGPRHSGTDRYPFVIVGNGATLDGSVSLAEAVWEYAGQGAFRTRPISKSFQQLFVDDQPAPRKQPPGGSRPKLGPGEWRLLEGWIYLGVDEGRLPQSYNLSCCGEQVGITVYNAHDVIIEDLNVRGFWLDGVNCHDNVRRTDLVRLNCRDNGRSGFSVGGASRVRIDTCQASGNGAAQVRTEGLSVVQMLDTALDAASAPAIVREGGQIDIDINAPAPRGD
jgi:hypothetical protein